MAVNSVRHSFLCNNVVIMPITFVQFIAEAAGDTFFIIYKVFKAIRLKICKCVYLSRPKIPQPH